MSLQAFFALFQVLEEFAQDFDVLCDVHLKKYYSTSPLSLIRLAKKDPLDELQVEIRGNYTEVTKKLKYQYDKTMKEHEDQKAKKLNDASCYSQLIHEKNIEKICKPQLFQQMRRPH